MAGRRLHRSGGRARSARQKAQLRNAQLISARKRKRNRRVVIGLASGVAVAGIAAGGVRYGRPQVARLRAKAAAYPYQKMTPELNITRSQLSKKFKADQKQIRELKNRAQLVARNKARRMTPEQRAESKKRRADYLSAYNDRRRDAYGKTRSVSKGVRPRKQRAKETKPRKRKTD